MKRSFSILLIFVLLVSLAGCSKAFVPSPEYTNLEFWIAQDVSDVDFSQHCEKNGWFGAREFYGLGYTPTTNDQGHQVDPNPCVKYLITAWPDYADGGQYVTDIWITDPKVTVYGLNTESSIADFDRVFSKMGYEITIHGDYLHSAYKDGFTFTLYSMILGQGYLRIQAEVSNRDGIMF